MRGTTGDQVERPGWSGGDPDAVIGWTLVQAGHAVGRRFDRALEQVGLSPSQFGVLVQLTADPGLSQAELARRVLVTPQSMGELVRSLARAGYVVRDTTAGRGSAIRISLTEAGRAALARATPLVLELNRPGALGLDAAEAGTLGRLLHKLLAATADG